MRFVHVFTFRDFYGDFCAHHDCRLYNLYIYIARNILLHIILLYTHTPLWTCAPNAPEPTKSIVCSLWGRRVSCCSNRTKYNYIRTARVPAVSAHIWPYTRLYPPLRPILLDRDFFLPRWFNPTRSLTLSISLTDPWHTVLLLLQQRPLII